MACRGLLECLLKLLNFVLSISGLAMIGYGIYLMVMWQRAAGGGGGDAASLVSGNPELLKIGRPMMMLVAVCESILDKLPKAWMDIQTILGYACGIFSKQCQHLGRNKRTRSWTVHCCFSFYAHIQRDENISLYRL